MYNSVEVEAAFLAGGVFGRVSRGGPSDALAARSARVLHFRPGAQQADVTGHFDDKLTAEPTEFALLDQVENHIGQYLFSGGNHFGSLESRYKL